MDSIDFYDHAGLMTERVGKLYSTHVGDDLAFYGFQEGANPPGDVSARARHPVYAPSMKLIGFGVVVFALLYMDHRIKVDF